MGRMLSVTCYLQVITGTAGAQNGCPADLPGGGAGAPTEFETYGIDATEVTNAQYAEFLKDGYATGPQGRCTWKHDVDWRSTTAASWVTPSRWPTCRA